MRDHAFGRIEEANERRLEHLYLCGDDYDDEPEARPAITAEMIELAEAADQAGDDWLDAIKAEDYIAAEKHRVAEFMARAALVRAVLDEVNT